MSSSSSNTESKAIVKIVFNVKKLEEAYVIECNLSTRNAKTFLNISMMKKYEEHLDLTALPLNLLQNLLHHICLKERLN
ncbi:hypothetical protein OUZ56_029651 [Daphnia magna]|uniref:Uncharacterized protein n=1 Tax=Daphnia magna TaxID=35525 RepID=A0ABR0B7H4_9CRUS|nr:hypothetical protein OUZ56_029651 [Daphnia magna]